MTEPTPTATAPARRGGFIEWSKTPFAIGIAAAIIVALLVGLFLGLARDHKSALDICSENGGSYNSYLKECTMPGADD
jgi:hypothetical protein